MGLNCKYQSLFSNTNYHNWSIVKLQSSFNLLCRDLLIVSWKDCVVLNEDNQVSASKYIKNWRNLQPHCRVNAPCQNFPKPFFFNHALYSVPLHATAQLLLVMERIQMHLEICKGMSWTLKVGWNSLTNFVLSFRTPHQYTQHIPTTQEHELSRF